MVYWPVAREVRFSTAVPAPDLVSAALELPPTPVIAEFNVSVLVGLT